MVVVLKYLEGEGGRVPLWNGDRASDGLVHSIPENLSVFILALRISLEILHTHTAIPHLPKMNPILYIDSNLVSRSLFLFLFPLPRSRLVRQRDERSTNSNFKFCYSSFCFSSCTKRKMLDIKYRRIRHLIVSRRYAGYTKGLTAIDIHVQYRKIIKLEKS